MLFYLYLNLSNFLVPFTSIRLKLVLRKHLLRLFFSFDQPDTFLKGSHNFTPKYYRNSSGEHCLIPIHMLFLLQCF